MMSPRADDGSQLIAVVVKGYPRLSETFIAQELLGLERLGHRLLLFSLRQPTDLHRHPIHDEINAGLVYLPEYLKNAPRRVIGAWRQVRRLPGYARAWRTFLRDLRRDPSPNRLRRFGQACVLAHELPQETGLIFAHFLHTPASVARYGAIMRGLPWAASAHAKDIWTSPDWEKREKLSDLAWLVTCTQGGAAHLRTLSADESRVHLVYHGLDLGRFQAPEAKPRAPDGAHPDATVRLLSVGRAVEKKGYDDLLVALSKLPSDLHWHFTHIGGGTLAQDLKTQAAQLGLGTRISWQGAQAQEAVLQAYRDADIFVLASKVAADGDRDGLPNVLMEAQSQTLACISTAVSAIPELIQDEKNGLLVRPGDPSALASAILRLARDPSLRTRLGRAGRTHLQQNFSQDRGLAVLDALLRKSLGQA